MTDGPPRKARKARNSRTPGRRGFMKRRHLPTTLEYAYSHSSLDGKYRPRPCGALRQKPFAQRWSGGNPISWLSVLMDVHPFHVWSWGACRWTCFITSLLPYGSCVRKQLSLLDRFEFLSPTMVRRQLKRRCAKWHVAPVLRGLKSA